MKITQEKQNVNLLNMSWKIPVFIFCYSPYCSICKDIHPAWDNLSKKYLEDPKIMIAEIDCNSHANICEGSYRVKGYPGFVKLLKAIPKKIHPSFDFDSIDGEASEMKQLKMDELCERFPVNEQKYPALVVSMTKNKVSVCAFIDMLVKDDKTLIPQTFARDNQEKDSFDIYLSSSHKVHMDVPFNEGNIINYMKEYRLQNFGTVKWSEVLARNRTIVIIVIKDQDQLSKFTETANQNSKDYYWGSITMKKYIELAGKHITELDTPAAIVSHKTKNKYLIVKNVTSNSLLEDLPREFGTYGQVINLRMSSVFHDLILFPGRSRTFRMCVFGILIAIVVGLIIGAFFCTPDSGPKFE